MADALKEFSTHTDKTFSQMQTGVTIASTTGSQTAVVKDVHITNDNQRSINLRLGSSTGPKILTCGNTGNYNGNEILDNSQSIVAQTDQTLIATSFVNRGWGDGDENGFGAPRGQAETYQYVEFNINNGNPVFSPAYWDGLYQTTNIKNYKDGAWPASSSSNQRIHGPSDSWVDAAGNIFCFSTASSISFGAADGEQSGSIGYAQLIKVVNNSSGTRGANISQIGSAGDCDAAAWDGSRYIYSFKHDGNHVRKYDTQTMGTNDTYTQIPIYNCATSDTTTMQFYVAEQSAGCYYYDGYLMTNGHAGGGVGGNISIVDLASGRLRNVYDPKRGNNNGISSFNNNRCRRSFGMVKDKYGDYWSVACNYNSDSNSADLNYWALTNMGSDPKTTFIPNGQTAKKELLLDMYDTGSSNHTVARRMAASDGRYFGNPRGHVVWAPNAVGKMYFYGTRYNQTAAFSGGYHGYILDIDAIADGKTDSSIMTRLSNSTGHTGAMELVADASAAADAWGTVSITTKGILTT